MQAQRLWFVAILVCLAAVADAQSLEMLQSEVVSPMAAEAVEKPAASRAIYGKPIGTLGIDISLPDGELPPDEAAALENNLVLVGNVPRPWPTQVYRWQAAATRHNPLYFEEINAERYGYGCHWTLQPAVSTAHFFGTLPALPYLMAANCPGECQYTLGHYRPGSCAPRRRHWWPCDPWGAASEAGNLAWMILVLP
ncbi:hypothetical protein [Aeoliella mucimassa]|uniref:Uncharacterized protein n=1 Tax=Aeoliella mucimassa TaxID=2527972 RepID=A0A518AIB3_9BACT|nr:hypothetical protein [Aeoliella mucimassa]QDU54475.1 hypothetical protein Pan181_06570 [Aeoliella mucimassa]